jgi:hypothetical protein
MPKHIINDCLKEIDKLISKPYHEASTKDCHILKAEYHDAQDVGVK